MRFKLLIAGWLLLLSLFSLHVPMAISHAQSCDPYIVVDEFDCKTDWDAGVCYFEPQGQATASCDQSSCYTWGGICSTDDEANCLSRIPGNCNMSDSDCSPSECGGNGGGGGQCSSTNGNLSCRGKDFGDWCPGPGECQPNGNTGTDGNPVCECDPGGGGGGPNNSPIGFIDDFLCSYNPTTTSWYFQGPAWAGDADDPNVSLRINYYVDDPGASDPSKLLGYVDPANAVTCDADTICNLLGGVNCAACAACIDGGPQCRHRANLINLSGINGAVQATLTNGSSHTITARAINIGPTGADAQLSGSITKNCAGAPACTINLSPASLSTYVGASGTTFTTTVSNNVSPVSYVSFNKTPSGSNIGSFSPLSDGAAPYTSVFTPSNAGSAGVTTVAMLNNGQYCSAYSPISVAPVAPPPTPSCTTFSATSSVLQGSNIAISCTANGDPLLSSVQFYYTRIVAGKNYCIGTDTTPPYDPINYWVRVLPVSLNLPFPFTVGTATASLNTTGIAVGDYYVVANIIGNSGNMCTGNPSGACGLANTTHCPNCSATTSIVACTPVCLTYCGQNNGCGGTCPNTHNGAPSPPPIIATPGSGGVVDLTSTNTVNFTWTDPDPNVPQRTDDWQVKVFNGYNTAAIDSIPCSNNPTSAQAICANPPAANKFYNFDASLSTRQNLGNYIKIAVRGHNLNCASGNVCTPFNGSSAPGYCSGWSTRTATLVADVNGTFYYDVDGDAQPSGNRCVDLDPNVSITLPSVTVTASFPPGPLQPIPPAPRQTTLPNASGFVMNDVPYWPETWAGANQSYSLTLPLIDPSNTYACTCPNGCQQAGVSAPDQAAPGEIRYFVNLYDLSQEAWWQAYGGHVYGPNGYISNMPDAGTECTPTTCQPYLVGQESSGAINNSAGVPITSGLNLIGTGGSYYSQRTNTITRVNNADFSRATREDYDYFSQNIDLATKNTIPTSPPGTIVTKPANCPNPEPDGSCIWFYNGDLTISPTNSWLFTGLKWIFFVNGDITFNNGNPSILDNIIGGNSTSFVAFIASGDITFNENVGYVDPASTLNAVAAQGLYVADGWLRVKATTDPAVQDRKFIGSGTFVGWSGVELERDFADNGYGAVDNKTYATETFRFRPTLLLNYPSSLRRPEITWQESN